MSKQRGILMEYPREKFPLLYKHLSTTLELLRGGVKFSYTEDGILAEKYINGYHVKAMIKEECDLECMLEVWEQNAYECYFPEETVALDLGMNIGLASLFFATMDNVSCIYSYELFEPTYQRGLMNIRLNPDLSDKIKHLITALGKKECLVKSISGVMRDIKNDINLYEMKLGIKMDIEGLEYEVFETLHKKDTISKRSRDLLYPYVIYQVIYSIYAIISERGWGWTRQVNWNAIWQRENTWSVSRQTYFTE